MSVVDELHFEDHVEAHLTSTGWDALVPGEVDPSTGLFTAELVGFVTETQPKTWVDLVERYGTEAAAIAGFSKRVAQELDNPKRDGVVDLLRHGVTDLGVDVDLAYFVPAHSLTPELAERYAANRLHVVRQLDVGKWKRADHQIIDLTLVVNGIPVATAELKNHQTGQNVGHAVKQYRLDRDAANHVLRRCVVHFAVDPDQVKMTTKLAGEATRFIPFNRGNAGGAGNPTPDGADTGKHRSFYLWEWVWRRDAFLDILGRFVVNITDPTTDKKATIFPRYHQWDAVNSLVATSQTEGPGHTYLVQHSAGSGKSNTIGWTAHRLANLHRADNTKVFDKVIVITDRTVLDDQLAETIFQFDHQHGVVKRVDPGKGVKSTQLVEALTDQASKIIITTLQTFPFVLEKLRDENAGLADKAFAVLIDEAHSSQTGKSATAVRAALANASAAEQLAAAEEEQEAEESAAPDPQDELNQLVAGKGRKENISFFAFTATPKPRTRELFGRLVDVGGEQRYAAFHLYTMRQAIEEGFILDVLKNYTTYHTYWKVEKSVREDPSFDERKAKAAIARFTALHPTNLAQKAEIIVEHFRQKVAPRIGGHAKAMIVTSSRLHAVRYKQALDKYIAAKGYTEVSTLVAFSGKVLDDGLEFSESGMNQFPQSETARRFDTDEYQVLIVAEKFQTGFDQPLLHTMYVDKPLSGLHAVQTLSRLNRTHPSKTECFVLDFRNAAEDITAAFAPFYEMATTAPTDPNLMYDARTELEQYDVIRPEEVDAYAVAFVSGAKTAHEKTEAALSPAVDRFGGLDEEQQDTFREVLDRFLRLHAFLSQVVTFTDLALEKLAVYARALQLKLVQEGGAGIDISDKIVLSHLKTEVTWEGDASVEEPESEADTFWGGRGPQSDAAQEHLSVIVEEMNERFGQGLTEEHLLVLDQYEGAFLANKELIEAALANNDIEAFKTIVFEPAFMDTIINQMDANEEIFKLILADDRMRALFTDYLAQNVYDRIRKGSEGSGA